jgi:hypothetical protein
VTARTGSAAIATALVVGALAGSIGTRIAVTHDEGGDVVSGLRRAVASERELREAVEDRLGQSKERATSLVKRLDGYVSDPLTIGARGFDPLIALEVGRMFVKCDGAGMTIALVEDRLSASVEVEYLTAGGPVEHAVLHPEHRLVTPVIGGASSWTIVQATEPKTVTARVEIGPPTKSCYTSPAAEASITTDDHSG